MLDDRPDAETVVNEHVIGIPAAPLRPWVAYYCGYSQHGSPSWLHREIPSPFLALVFTLDEPLVLRQHNDRRTSPGRYDTLLSGLHTSPVLIEREGTQSGIHVHLRPLGARALLGLPSGELAGLGVRAEDVVGGLVNEIRYRTIEASDWRERFAVMDRVLLRSVREAAGLPSELRHAWSLLLRTSGDIRITDLARETGWSERRMGRVMRTEIGLSPKSAARVIRFDHTRRRLQHDGPGDIAAIAADLAYTDQAHLTHEFVAMAGLAPTLWLTAEFGLHTYGEYVVTSQSARIPEKADIPSHKIITVGPLERPT